MALSPQQGCSVRGKLDFMLQTKPCGNEPREEIFRMSRHATGIQEPVQEFLPSPPLPADHVLSSGAVTFPGVFDQHGCPLVIFPVDGQAKLSELSKAEVVDFINYFQCLHNKRQEKPSLVSLVADLRHTSIPTTGFIAETLLLLEEIDAFAQEFLSVVQCLPSCISTLQALSRLPLPSSISELQHFCSVNEAKFLQLRRELGLDELLRHCESVVDKLRYPDRDPCYQAMAGTALFTHTAFDMLQNHSRITAAVEKVELLWQQAFSKAHLQLQVFQLRSDALQITERIETLKEKLQLYRVEIARDSAKAKMLLSEFEASIHTPAMGLIRCAEDVTHMLAEILPLEAQTSESWALDLQKLKKNLHSAVHFILQTLRTVSDYHSYFNKATSWYNLVLHENFLQELLTCVQGDAQWQRKNCGTIPAWRWRLSAFQKNNPPPDLEELLHLSNLSNAVPDDKLQQAGSQISQRCLTLRKLLISSGPVSFEQLQLALQWQYELLCNNHLTHSSEGAADEQTNDASLGPSEPNVTKCEAAHLPGTSPLPVTPGMVLPEYKPPSLSSFDSGFDGAGSSQLKACARKEVAAGLCTLAGNRDSVTATLRQCQIHESISSISDCEGQKEEFDLGSVGASSMAIIQIKPKAEVDFLNFEIKVKRSAALPNNPWLSLPVEDLEDSYTVTITQNPTPQKRECRLHDAAANQSNRSRDQPTQTEVMSTSEPPGSRSMDWILNPPDPELSPMHNILSSTIHDGRDQSVCTTEGIPTLLWDSYDLHDQNPDPVDGGMTISLKDWDVKEQESHREVEKILDRTDEILEEEENVLVQEAVLDALLRKEDGRDVWPLWDSEDHCGIKMSSSELAEAGVLGLDECLSSGESDSLSEPELADCVDDHLDDEAEVRTDEGSFHIRPNLLMELRKIHILDELILEEKFKIQQLRCSSESPPAEPSESTPLVTQLPLNINKDIEAFRLQLEKEKREVEKLEKGLDEEHMHRSKDKATECLSLPRKNLLLVQNNSGVCHSETFQALLGLNVAEEEFPLSWSQDACKDKNSLCEANILNSTSDLREPSEVGIQPNASQSVSLTSELRPDEGAFDPGGIDSLSPDTKEGLSPYSTKLISHNPCNAQDKALENIDPDLVFNPNVKEYSNNNNNNAVPDGCGASLAKLSEMTTKDEEAMSVVPACSLQPAEKIKSLPQIHSESEPIGDDELEEDSSNGALSSEAMRVSSCRSQGMKTQLDDDIAKMANFKTPIVLDTGSGLMKAGFADQKYPNIIFPTIIGMPKYEEIMNGDLQKETYIGHNAQHMRGVLALKHPMKNGVIQNWDEMEKIWHHTFQQLTVDPEDHPVLLTEAAINPLENRQRMVEMMFECFSVPWTYVAMQAVLALYAAGRTTGVVFDSGDGVSHSMPVFEGYCLPHAVQRFPLAGVDVTMHLKKLLQEQGVCMRTTAEEEIVREMKEKCCCVALNYEAELSQEGSSCREMYYSLPDGQIVTLGTERFRAPEILFQPQLIGRDHYGMHKSVFKSILSSDVDLRRCFLENIVLSGGNTLLPGLPERLQAEIKSLVPADMGVNVRVTSPKDRDFLVWSGGAVLANLPTFSSAWISHEEYEEYGPQIVFRKCF
ncbi:uncharacterized protein LOC121633367 isoform X1 [Melanotaenia boesemani]|uniref:uncharacterized protein LOC121633367 isoform X1 n=2 Tax=Melanotaenia boesemani TaxID=1250792 RepID=UPI001C04D60E|nr:uncharacterized protein LOC121633367 isoform X1 [Melanotaenia boesemani]